MSQIVGSNSSYKLITNTAWVRAQLCKLQKRCIRLAAASDKVYQLLAQDRWFSPCTPASSTTKTGCHDIAEILLKVALIHQKSNQNHKLQYFIYQYIQETTNGYITDNFYSSTHGTRTTKINITLILELLFIYKCNRDISPGVKLVRME